MSICVYLWFINIRGLALVDVAGVDGWGAVGGGEAHGGFEFFLEDFEHLADALLAAGAEGVDHCPAKEDAGGAEGAGAEDVDAGADAGIEQQLDIIAYCLFDCGEEADAAAGAVELAAAVVGDDQGFDAHALGNFGVFGVHDAFEYDGAAPLLLDPFDVLPIESRVDFFGSPDYEAGEVIDAFSMADDVAEGAVRAARHGPGPPGFAEDVDEVFEVGAQG